MNQKNTREKQADPKKKDGGEKEAGAKKKGAVTREGKGKKKDPKKTGRGVGPIPPCDEGPCQITWATIRPFRRNFFVLSASRDQVNPRTGEVIPGTSEPVAVSLNMKARNHLSKTLRHFVYGSGECVDVHCYCESSGEIISETYDNPIIGTTSFDLEVRREEYVHKIPIPDPGTPPQEQIEAAKGIANDVLGQILSGEVTPVSHSSGMPFTIDPDVDQVTLANVNCCANISATYWVHSVLRYEIGYVARATLTTVGGTCRYRSG